MILNQNKPQNSNQKLIAVRQTFDQYNLISGLHSFMSIKNQIIRILLPPLTLLEFKHSKELIKKLII